MSSALHNYLRRYFSHQVVGHSEVYLSIELGVDGAHLVEDIHRLLAQPALWVGNRHSIAYMEAGDSGGKLEVVVRRGRRGGWVSSIADGIYLGFEPRQFVELAVATRAFLMGLPVAQPLGAVVDWLGPGIYRGYYLSRRVLGCTMWQFVQQKYRSRERTALLTTLKKARSALERVQNAGLYHCDLTLHNFFVSNVENQSEVVLLDLDRARFYSAPLSYRHRRRNRLRLLRSVRKLDPEAKIFDCEALSCLGLIEVEATEPQSLEKV